MPSLNHVHTYKRMPTNKNYYMCADPHCSHYTRKELILGKASLCNNCTHEFILSKEDLRRSRPVCPDCSDTAEARQKRAAKALVEGLLGDVDKEKGVA